MSEKKEYVAPEMTEIKLEYMDCLLEGSWDTTWDEND